MTSKLAVCMPAFNAADVIERSINSILSQTYSDFKFIITDDDSTDETAAIISSIKDPRISLFQNLKNIGGAATRNRMIDFCIANGFKYMAIMDADDIASPTRFQRQVTLLDQDPSLAIVGSSMRVERNNAVWVAPETPAAIKSETIFGNSIPTSTATLRIRFLEQLNLRWDTDYVPCADYQLWQTMLFEHNLRARNTGTIEVLYTFSPKGISHSDGQRMQEEKDAEVKRNIIEKFGINAPQDELKKFTQVALNRSESGNDADGFISIATALLKSNLERPLVDHSELCKSLRIRASNYLSKTKNLDRSTAKLIRKELKLPTKTPKERLERYLRALKFKFLTTGSKATTKQCAQQLAHHACYNQYIDILDLLVLQILGKHEIHLPPTPDS